MEDIYKKLELTIAKNRYQSYTHPPYELECELMRYIKEMDLVKSIETLNKINSLERANLSKFPINSLKYSLIASCTLFTRAVIEAGLDYETAFLLSDYCINLIDTTNTEDKLQRLEFKMMEDFIKILKTHKSYKYNPLINRIISYIKKNTEKQISLQEIADHVKMHPNYISAAFKKEVGKTLTGYINEQRINAIKLYLQHTNLTISEVSDVFNFGYVTYFSRFFKTHTGLTPMKYKKQCSSI